MPAPSLASLIQKCTSTTSLNKARQLHAIILTTIHPNTQSTYLHNNIISMYSRTSSFGYAQQVFDRMPMRNVVSYNALIAAYSRLPEHEGLAFSLFTQMEAECFRPNGSTFTSLFRAACGVGDWLMGCVLHTRVVKFGFSSDSCLLTSMLGMYSSCGDLVSAEKVFGCMEVKDAVAWNSMILGNFKNGMVDEGIFLFGEMLLNGVEPTGVTYSVVLNACSRLRYYGCGRVFHGRILVSGMVVDLLLQNVLLDMYCSCGDKDTAFSVFKRIENPDLVSWNSMIAGCSDTGEEEKAMHFFVQLRKMSLPKPDEYTFAAVVSATCTMGVNESGKPLHAQVVKAGYERSIYAGSTLVSVYFKYGDALSANKVFDMINEKDVVLWTEMIVGHARMADAETALGFFSRMCQEGYSIDSFALSGTLGACADLATLKPGEMLHSYAFKTGCDLDMPVCGSLVDMYAKNGNLQAAWSIFSQVSNPDMKCWNSMLSGYGQHGQPEPAFNLFFQILERGLKPDEVTFLTLLSACSHNGLVESGKILWKYMKENDIIPNLKHYSCIVSLLSRAGLLKEAEEIINEAPYGVDCMELWRNLLSSCVENRNLRVGTNAAENILKLDEEDSAAHILLSNLFAATGKWDRVAETRKKIRSMMLEKDPGLSWMESNNCVHVFSSSDQSHPNVDDAQDELYRLKRNMILSKPDELEACVSVH